MGNITFLFSNNEEKTLDFGANNNISMSKNFTFNISDNYKENKWELRGGLETLEIDQYINDIINMLKNNTILKIKITVNNILYEYSLEDINQISYNIFDKEGKDTVNEDYAAYLFTIILK